MNQFLKKTWLLFYFIAFSTFVMLVMSISLKYDELEHKLKTEQHYIIKLFDSYVSTAFSQFETMSDLISYNISSTKDLKTDIIDTVVESSPLLIGYALFSPDGETISLSNTMEYVHFPNLLTKDTTKTWFKQALARDQMSIGRPYHLKYLDKWLIPLRKRMLNKKGEVIGIISSGVDLQALSLQWNDDPKTRRMLQAVLNYGYYPVLRTNIAHNNYPQYYNNPINNIEIQEIETKLALQNLSLDILRKTGQTAQLKTQKNRYATVVYSKKYQLWFSVGEPDHLLRQALIQYALNHSAFYLLFLVIIFFLFRWVIRIEKSKIIALTYRVEHDLLTGLNNRCILNEIERKYYKNKQSFSLLYIDLDHFKSINDSYGYSYGDLLLIEVSKRIKKDLHKVNGTAIRHSADEFILLIELIDKEQIEQYCQMLLNKISAPYLIKNNDLRMSASIGIARNPNKTIDIETLISYANNSMLIAKESKNMFVFFSKEIHLQLIKSTQIEQALHHALEKNEISMVYQPQLDNQQQLCGVEALVRWNNDELGIIPPDQFIPIAEDTGLMPEIGVYIMRQAMSEISTLQYKKKKSFQLSINVSARQFVQINFLETLLECLACFKSPYMNITIEITESLFIENIEHLLPIFKKMKNKNISLSLDDFGTGYSSLNMLRKVPIDELKIDKSFVAYISSNKNDRAMVEGIITMGKNMGMTVLAEGVETEQQATILKNAGCDIYQGYYFSKPLNLADLEDFIDKL